VTIEVRVQPRARRNALVAAEDGSWKLYLTAPAVEGKANDALVDFFAKGLKIPRARVHILTGEKSRRKVVLLDGITSAALAALESGQ
jgi:uncharacterized protein (TIGR00251 family)